MAVDRAQSALHLTQPALGPSDESGEHGLTQSTPSPLARDAAADLGVFIVLGILAIFGLLPGTRSVGASNLTGHGGFFPHGYGAVVTGLLGVFAGPGPGRPLRHRDQVTDLSSTLAGQRRIEDIVGSQIVIEPATGQLKLTIRLLRDARGPLADDLAAVGSEASQFAGWLHTATGRHDRASDLYDQALRLGLQAGDKDLAATALSMHGHLAWVTGDIGSMATLSQAAEDMAHATGTRTVAIQQRGRALAILGDRRGALRAIGEAEHVLARGDTGEDPDSLYFYGHECLTMQRGLILSYLADTPADYSEAALTISAAVEALPPSVRDSEWVAWYRVRASAALAAAGEVDGAVEGLRYAYAIVSTTGGGRALIEITKVQAGMAARWPTHPAVIKLGTQITES
jgi:tetratricopeptide (TPR) repeat protein